MKRAIFVLVLAISVKAFGGDSRGGSGGTVCGELFSDLKKTIPSSVSCQVNSDCQYRKVKSKKYPAMWVVFLGNGSTDPSRTQDALDEWVEECAVPADISCGLVLPQPLCMSGQCAHTGASYCLNPSPS